MTTIKTAALTRWTFVGRVVILLFNMLSRLVTAFLPRSKGLLISWLQSASAVTFGDQGNKVCYCFHCFLMCLPWSDGRGRGIVNTVGIHRNAHKNPGLWEVATVWDGSWAPPGELAHFLCYLTEPSSIGSQEGVGSDLHFLTACNIWGWDWSSVLFPACSIHTSLDSSCSVCSTLRSPLALMKMVSWHLQAHRVKRSHKQWSLASLEGLDFSLDSLISVVTSHLRIYSQKSISVLSLGSNPWNLTFSTQAPLTAAGVETCVLGW